MRSLHLERLSSLSAGNDGDGSPDYSELAFGSDPWQSDAAGDKGGDVQNNLTEYFAVADQNDSLLSAKMAEMPLGKCRLRSSGTACDVTVQLRKSNFAWETKTRRRRGAAR